MIERREGCSCRTEVGMRAYLEYGIVKGRAKTITAIAETNRIKAHINYVVPYYHKVQYSMRVRTHTGTSTSPPPPRHHRCLPASCSAASAQPQVLRLDRRLLRRFRYCLNSLRAQQETARVEARPSCEESEYPFLGSMPKGPHDQAGET
jgi:hypothetical protein